MLKYCTWEELPVPCDFTRSSDKKNESVFTLLSKTVEGDVVKLSCCDTHAEIHEIEFTKDEAATGVRFRVVDTGVTEESPGAASLEVPELKEDGMSDDLVVRLQDIHKVIGDARKRGKKLEKILPELTLKLKFAEQGLDDADAERYLTQHLCIVEKGAVKLPAQLPEGPVDFEAWAALVRDDGTFAKVTAAKAAVADTSTEESAPVADAASDYSPFDAPTPEAPQKQTSAPELQVKCRECILSATLAMFKLHRTGRVDASNMATAMGAIHGFRTKPHAATGRPPFGEIADVPINAEMVAAVLVDEAGCDIDESENITPPEGVDVTTYTVERWLEDIESAEAEEADADEAFFDPGPGAAEPAEPQGFGEGIPAEPPQVPAPEPAAEPAVEAPAVVSGDVDIEAIISATAETMAIQVVAALAHAFQSMLDDVTTE